MRTSAQDFLSASVEDYAKPVYALETRGGAAVPTNDLASRRGVTPASVSGMVRKLTEVGIVEHESYHGVRLTEEGRRVALEVLRHHRLLELFLNQELGMSWDRVHAEAEVLERVLSEELEALIVARLAVGMNPTNVLVLSQVVLSFGIPFALVPLVMLTGRSDIMGAHVNCRTLKISAWTIATAISLMNIFLIYQQFFIS